MISFDMFRPFAVMQRNIYGSISCPGFHTDGLIMDLDSTPKIIWQDITAGFHIFEIYKVDIKKTTTWSNHN